MKVYTGAGDAGQTQLFSGESVPKFDDRVEAYGTIDELNASLGGLAAQLPPGDDVLASEIRAIQVRLLRAGALLATRPQSPQYARLQPIEEADFRMLEQAIDRMEESLEPLKSLILPGGHPAAAQAHIARTVCRRAERRILRYTVESAPAAPLPQALRTFFNRLSDYLFVVARYCNHLAGETDTAWQG